MTARIEQSIDINASAETVWKVLTDNQMASKWVSEFMPNSTVEGDWREGGVVDYKDAEGAGLRCTISVFQPHSHLRVNSEMELNHGKEDPQNPDNAKWVGCYDSYTLEEHGDHTHLAIEIICPEEYYETFEQVWEASLEKIKELSESH